MSMNIQSATTADIPDILTLLKASALPTAGIERHVETALIVRDSGQLLGCAAVEVYGQAGLLRSVAVEVEHRGEGWGERLAKAALELARERGVRDIYLLTTSRCAPRSVLKSRAAKPRDRPSRSLRGSHPIHRRSSCRSRRSRLDWW